MTLPKGINLDQYKTQAKELLKQARAARPEALDRLRQHHPERKSVTAHGAVRLADAQLVIARENEFPSWAKFKDYLLFRNAVQALDSGDIRRLEALLDKHKFLVRYHCRVGEWYEKGYFAGATLLNHIAGNPIRCPIPENILDIARLILSRGGADARPRPKYTIGLLLTSKQASEAGVALPLIDLLIADNSPGREERAGLDLNDPDILNMPLLNSAPATAEELIRRGAKMDVRHAAALGRIETLTNLLAGTTDQTLLEEALIYACFRRQEEAATLLSRYGAKGDVLLKINGFHQTALHVAADEGCVGIVKTLLGNGASASVRDSYWKGTAADWAEYGGGHPALAALLREHESA